MMVARTSTVDREELVQRVEALHPEALDQVNHAIDFATAAHGDQRRASGEPFMVHPLEVAAILVDLRMDAPSVIAGVLHDILEDTAVPYEDLKDEFGETVARLVDGVTKLRRVKRKSIVDYADLDEEQAESLRKMFLAMVDDVRVVIIKLADRLHNMRTLQHLSPDRQLRKARETLDVFAPLANRLGIWQLKWQLEDLSFRYLDPDRYREIAAYLAERRVERAAYLERVIAVLRERLEAEGIVASITGRPKHIYSIYTQDAGKTARFRPDL
jgi:(p)ppGpp synthase/HD superfamily hydrolase